MGSEMCIRDRSQPGCHPRGLDTRAEVRGGDLGERTRQFGCHTATVDDAYPFRGEFAEISLPTWGFGLAISTCLDLTRAREQQFDPFPRRNDPSMKRTYVRLTIASASVMAAIPALNVLFSSMRGGVLCC